MWTAIMMLLLVWLIGLAASYTMGGLIHLALVAAILLLLAQVLRTNRSN